MKEFIKTRAVTLVVVFATIILAGVAVFTAIRLYQLRQESVSLTSPESQPSAWNCSQYTFSVDAGGTVTVVNNSSRNEPAQKADVFINDEKKATFDVPALSTGQTVTLGKVTVNGAFSWKVVGTADCQNSGQSLQACQSLTFTISGTAVSPTSSPTVTPTKKPTSTPTPTDSPIGGGDLTPTLTPTATPTVTPRPTSTATPTPTPTPTNAPIGGADPTPTTIAQATPTPTTGLIAQVSPTSRSGASAGTNDELPAAGVSLPTILIVVTGFLLIIVAFILAL